MTETFSDGLSHDHFNPFLIFSNVQRNCNWWEAPIWCGAGAAVPFTTRKIAPGQGKHDKEKVAKSKVHQHLKISHKQLYKHLAPEIEQKVGTRSYKCSAPVVYSRLHLYYELYFKKTILRLYLHQIIIYKYYRCQ